LVDILLVLIININSLFSITLNCGLLKPGLVTRINRIILFFTDFIIIYIIIKRFHRMLSVISRIIFLITFMVDHGHLLSIKVWYFVYFSVHRAFSAFNEIMIVALAFLRLSIIFHIQFILSP